MHVYTGFGIICSDECEKCDNDILLLKDSISAWEADSLSVINARYHIRPSPRPLRSRRWRALPIHRRWRTYRGETSSQGEWSSQSICEAKDDIANNLIVFVVLLLMFKLVVYDILSTFGLLSSRLWRKSRVGRYYRKSWWILAHYMTSGRRRRDEYQRLDNNSPAF